MVSDSWKKRYKEAKESANKQDKAWEQSRQEYWASRPKPLPTATRVNKVDVQDERAAQSRARVNTANQRMANLSAKQSGLIPLGSGERMEDVNSELSALRHEQDLVSQYNNDLPYQLKRGWSLGTESAGTALLGAAEGLTDIIGSGFYAGLSGLTSLGGLAPNPVSEWALEQGQAFLDNSVTRDWEESIEERYNPTDAEKRVLGIGKSVAQMLPAIGVSKVVGAAQAAPKAVSAAKGLLTGERVGQALFGLQAAGNAASQAKQEGASLGQSVAYGAASGLAESLIERVSGGIPGLGNGVLDDVAARVASNPIVRNSLDILGEGGEEAVSAVLDPYLRRAMYDPDAKNATPQEIAEAAVTGAIAAGVLKGGIELPTAVGNTVSRVRTVRDSVGTNQDIAARVNASIAEGNGPFRPYEQNRTESKMDRVPGEYRAETPQNVEYPTVPIINLSMQNVADMNGGTLPASGNALRKQAISRARKNLGLDETGTIYIPASNVTRNGEEYILKITRSTLNKMLSPSNGGVVQPESLVVLDNIDRIANNGVYFKSEGDRKGRDQIAGYDHLMTTVYIDNQPYTVDMRVRVYDEKTGGGNTLYYFTPEEIITTKKVDADLPTGTLHERTMIQEAAPTSISTIPQNRSYGNQKAGQDIESLKRKTGIEVPIAQRTWEDASNRKVNAFQYDHPELRPYYQQAARELQTELLSGTKGERFAITDSDGYVTGYTGTKRSVSEPVAQARDNANLSYEQIQKAIDDLIADHGQENYAAAKKVEMVLDDMLTNGYTDVSGQYVEPNEAYVAARDGVFSAQQDGDSQYRMSEEEWNSIFAQDVGPESSVGAASYGFDPYTNLQGRYGTIQPGENPARVVDVPSRTEDHNKVSLTARTVMEAAATPDAAVPVIAQMVVDGRFSHIPVSNAQRAEMAENRIQKTGYQDALSNWRADVRAGKSSADITAMGAQLYNAAVNAGRTGEAMDILYDYTQAIRAGAQATQAARILKTLTPSGRLYMLQKEVNNLNDKLSEKQKKAAGKKQSVSAEDNVPVELWMQRVGETLADRLASRVNAPKETTRTVAQTVLSDLQRYSNETAPKSLPTGKKRTEMDRIMDLFQNRTAYEEAWQAAKDTLSDQFEDNPEALAAFDEWLDSSLDYTKRLTKELTNQDAIVIDESLADAYLSAQTEADRKAAYDQIVQSIADQIPPTFADKWNAWRYMSMLANPRTHIRNIVGNLGFQPVRLAKDEIAALIEGSLSLAGVKMDRTKSFVAAPELYQAAWKDFSNVADSLSGSKYGDVSSEINDRRRIFKAKPLERVRTGNSNLLELEDVVFKRVTYADALAKFLQANGATAEQLSSGQIDTNLLERARAYAGQQALKATYQDRNAVSDKVVQLSRMAGPFGEAIMPFKRTPANILVRGLEYSPAGLAKSLTVDLAKVKQGKMTAAEAIDNVAAGITGTGLMALGAYLFMNGMVTGGGGDETQDALDDLTGKQNYALNLPGGGSITLDWLAPEALPFFMGVRMAETLGEDGVTGDDIIASFGAVVDPMLEMSMLQSLNDLIDSVSYVDSAGKIPAIAGSALVSYFSQGVPTLFGQIERSFEDKRMTTYTDKGSKIPTDVQYALGRASARIPGQDYQQIPYIDAWGREEESGARPLRIFNNFLNPSYTSTENVTPVDAEAQRLYDALGESARIVVPKRAEKSITVDGETVYLDADQYVEYAKKKGQTAYDVLSAIIQTDAYQNMSDADKVSVFEDVYKYANDIGKMAVSNYKPEDLTAKMLQTGVSADKYMVYYQTADANRDGNITQGESAAALLPVAGLTTQEKGKIWQSQNKDWSTEKNPFTGALANAGISPNLATEIMNRYSEINSAAYSGSSVARQKQTALSKYLDGLKLSEKQRAVVDDTYKFYTMFPAEPIAYSVNTMSDAAQEKWPIVKSYGMSESDYLKYYPIVSSSEKGKTKEMKIRELQEAGLSYNQADTFWDIVKSK
jgi:hypothetical protein|nr:MAG TPA: Large polyvalent protein-associated domain 3 [Caudoviricetes sp.]